MTALARESGTVIEIQPVTRRRRGPVRWAGAVLSWAVMLGVGAVVVAALLVPKLAGATPYVIETGSMRPSLPPGTMVIAKPVDPVSIKVGDVITYQIRSGDPTVVTHRVVAMGFDGLGNPRWRTQGDTNNAPDKKWVQPQQVRGKEWYAVPYLGHVAFATDGDARRVLMGVVVLGLIGYALRMFRQSWLERRASRGAS